MSHNRGGHLAIIFFWLSVLSLTAAQPLFAGGDHSEAAPALAGMRRMTFEGFQVELLIAPTPLRLGADNKITVKIAAEDSLQPVRNGRVSIGMVPARLLNRPATEQNARANPTPLAVPLSHATETVWAGSYTVAGQVGEKGSHLVRVAIAELNGRIFKPPAVFDFQVHVEPAAGFSASFWLFGLTAILIASAGIYGAVLQGRHREPLGIGLNLLQIRWLNGLVRWKGFQPALQIPTFIVIGVIAYLGFVDVQDGAKNLATRLTWILWWPGIIFTFITVGRLWCVMCPFGALNEAAAAASRPERSLPKPLRNLWLATLLFLLLTWADEQIGVIRSPQLTAWLIVLFALFAVATGIFFQRRSFCRYLCPITGLLGLYSMFSPVEVRSADRDRCQKNCRQDCYRGAADGKGCSMFEFPMTVDRNTFCNVCFECARSCPNDNLALRFRAFGRDLWMSTKRCLDEAYLSVVLVGVTTILTAQMLNAWGAWVSGVAKLIPTDVRLLMKPVTYLTITESVVFFVGSLILFPALGLGAAWLANRLFGEGKRMIRKTFTHMAYMFLPVGLAMHLAHNVSHLVTEGPGIVPALQRTIQRYTSLDVSDPNWQFAPLMSADSVYWLEMVLILGGFIVSLVVGHRLALTFFDRHANTGKALIPFVALSLLFTIVNFYLLNQPMGARH